MSKTIASDISIEPWRFPGQYLLRVGEEHLAEIRVDDGLLKIWAIDGHLMHLRPSENAVIIDFGMED